jgi:hypothetical protein
VRGWRAAAKPLIFRGRGDTFERVTARLLDVVALLLLVASGAAFYLGADAITTHKDINAIYFVVVGVVLVRGASNLARADRASG